MINGDRNIKMIGDSQASESAGSTLFGMRPEKKAAGSPLRPPSTNFCRGSISSWSVFGRPLHKLWSADATQLIATYLVSSVFRPFTAFSGALDLCRPLQIQRIRVIKEIQESKRMTNESKEIDVTHVRNLDVTANPAALGLTAFGVTTVLLNLSNAGYFALGSMILAMGIFYGGLAQVIAGIMEWKKSNTFGMTAFLSFGFFWLSLVTLLVLPKLGLAAAPSATALAAYFAMWGLFTLVMFIGSLKTNRALQVVLGLLTVLFFLLAIGEITGNANVVTIAGYEGILTGFAAIYAGLAQVLNEMYKRTVAPLG